MSPKALIVVDMLNDFVDETGALYCGESSRAIVPFIKQRLNVFRENRDPVIYLKDSHDKNDKEFEKFPEHCLTDTWGSEIVPDLAPQAGEKVISNFTKIIKR